MTKIELLDSETNPTRRSLSTSEETVAYLELTARQTFGVAFALVRHCRQLGAPVTPLQHELCGLRDFLLGVLDEHQVEVLLDSI